MVWDGGYAGLQRAGSRYDRQLQFSIWDTDGHDAQVIEHARDVVCSPFGGEGTGQKCELHYPWRVGRLPPAAAPRGPGRPRRPRRAAARQPRQAHPALPAAHGCRDRDAPCPRALRRARARVPSRPAPPGRKHSDTPNSATADAARRSAAAPRTPRMAGPMSAALRAVARAGAAAGAAPPPGARRPAACRQGGRRHRRVVGGHRLISLPITGRAARKGVRSFNAHCTALPDAYSDRRPGTGSPR